MRILWFINNPIRKNKISNQYNGGGWMSSLMEVIAQIENIQLNVCFIEGNEYKREVANKINIYSVPNAESGIYKKLIKYLPFGHSRYVSKVEAHYVDNFNRVIEDCNPDIIHIFGSESYFGLIAEIVNLPVVIHIQGILNPYLNAFLPPFVSWQLYMFSFLSPRYILNRYCDMCNIKDGAIREKRILRKVNYFMGRTEWDKRIINVYNPQAKYFYCSEILRQPFYREVVRVIPNNLKIVTVISKPLYKGFDLVLKTCKLLCEEYNLGFEWHVFGNIDTKYYQKAIRSNFENIILRGVVDAEKIVNEISSATLYFHSSYIDNSPNTISEAMILGVPVIATNVGGIGSLIEDGKNGFLIPANDPFQGAYLIKKIFDDIMLNSRIGEEARDIAMKRHDKNTILRDLLNCYTEISKK